jgi:hypothetical protein
VRELAESSVASGAFAVRLCVGDMLNPLRVPLLPSADSNGGSCGARELAESGVASGGFAVRLCVSDMKIPLLSAL